METFTMSNLWMLLGVVLVGIAIVGIFMAIVYFISSCLAPAKVKDEKSRFPKWAIVAVYDLDVEKLYFSWEGLEVVGDNYCWSFRGEISIVGQGRPFVLPDGRRLGVIVLDSRRPMAGYVNKDEPSLEELAAELAEEAVRENHLVPKGQLSIYVEPRWTKAN